MERPKSKILCVDDERLNLVLLKAVLEPRGYEVILAENGKEALARLGEQAVDLVILDVMMPEMDGFAVCEAIKNQEQYSHLPVIMITALRAKEDRIKGINAGAEDFISKPFDQEEVLARVKMLLHVKDLHDRLHQAYAKLTAISAFGKSLITGVDPLHYDFAVAIEQIIAEFFGKSTQMEGPQLVLLHFADNQRNRQWLVYEAASGGLRKRALAMDTDLGTGTAEARVVYCNDPGLAGSALQPLAGILTSLDLPVANAVGYLSPSFCFAAVNYERAITDYDAAVLDGIIMQSLFTKSMADRICDLDDAFGYTVNALARAAEVNDEDTGDHIVRVGEYCALIANHLGMPEHFINLIRLQAQMHDVGKIHIRPDILNKPGRLTAEEYEEVKGHPVFGAKILGDHTRLTLAKEIALSHYERWDGGGYSYGLRGETIPLSGRIMNLDDQYDALKNQRVYKPAFDHATTYTIIAEGDGRTLPGHFDPRILEVFKRGHQEFEAIYEALK